MTYHDMAMDTLRQAERDGVRTMSGHHIRAPESSLPTQRHNGWPDYVPTEGYVRCPGTDCFCSDPPFCHRYCTLCNHTGFIPRPE